MFTYKKVDCLQDCLGGLVRLVSRLKTIRWTKSYLDKHMKLILSTCYALDRLRSVILRPLRFGWTHRGARRQPRNGLPGGEGRI